MKFKDYLKNQKLTLTEFALSIKMNPSTLWHATKNGKKMSLNLASRIVKASSNKVTYQDLVKEFSNK